VSSRKGIIIACGNFISSHVNLKKNYRKCPTVEISKYAYGETIENGQQGRYRNVVRGISKMSSCGDIVVLETNENGHQGRYRNVRRGISKMSGCGDIKMSVIRNQRKWPSGEISKCRKGNIENVRLWRYRVNSKYYLPSYVYSLISQLLRSYIICGPPR
jgi:hypothetical protein